MTLVRCLFRLRLMRSAFCLLLLSAMPPACMAQEVTDASSLIDDLLSAASAPKVDTLQQSGAGVTRIPVQVPPGRLGLAPQLAIAYNSYAKNGWLGVGFGLEMGAIQRSTKWGVDYQGRDFSVSLGGGADELVARPEWGGAMYGARIESAFTKYLFKGATDGWEAWLKDGRRLSFGSSAAARQDDPANPARVFKWCLDRVEDANGNWMSIEYVKDRGELYPARIAYAGNRGLAPSNTVLFHLEDRPDWAFLCTTNFGVATAKRLKTIEVRAGGVLVRAYALAYTLSPSTGRSLLADVRHFGTDSRISAAGDIVSGSTLPPASFEWQTDAQGAFTRPPASGSVTQGFRFNGSRDAALPFDFDGDGRMDLFLYRPGSSTAAVMRSNGDGSFTQTVLSGTGFAGYNLRHQDDKAIAFDFDGDGRSDLFFYRPDTGNVGVVRSNGDGSFTAVYLSDFGIGGYDFRSLRDRVFAFDFNGDGKSDLCFYRPGDGIIFILRSNGDGSFTPVTTSWSGIAGFDLMGPTDRAFAFDFDGDGRSDLCLYRPDRGLISIARSNGDGTFATTYLSGNGIAGYDLRGRRDVVLPFDFNGDGKSDLFIYRPDGGLACVVRSNGDGTFSQAYLSWNGIAGYDLRGSADQVMPFDFNGDGKSDLFIYRPDVGLACVARSNGDGSFTQVYLSWSGIAGYDLLSARDVAFPFDFDGDGKSDIFFFRPRGGTFAVIRSGTAVPDLLARVDNGFGGATTLTYTASSAYPNHHLPFVVHPVSAIEVHDGLPESPGIVTRFDYRGGYYDVAERQFRGFETITQTRPDGTADVTVFHQDTLLQGKTRRAETREAPAGAVTARSDFTWATSQLRGGAATFVRPARRLSTLFDGETVATDEAYVHDEENGNLLRTTTSGTGAESVVRTTAWRNFSTWLFRPTVETLEGSASGKVRTTVMEYEAPTGNLKSRTAWLDGGADPTTTCNYDAFGNPVAVTDPLGNVTRTDYDPETRTFPVRVQAPRTGEVDHVTHVEVDPRFGRPLAAIDANGNRTAYAYDEFGRPVATFAPDGGEARVDYFDDGVPALVVARVKENESGGWIRRHRFVDGFGRTVQTVAFGEGGKPIVQRLFYDAMGRNHYSAGPFFASGADYPQPLPQAHPYVRTTFDRRGRPIRVERPDHEHGAVAVTFAPSGLAVTTSDPDGAARTERKDYLGRVVEVIEHTEAGDAATSYAYNAAGDLLRVENALRHAVTMSYDTLGRKLAMDDPDMGQWAYAYDPAGRLVAQSDAKGQTIGFSHDALGRVVAKTYSTADPPVAYVYDGPVENGIGRLYRVANAAAETTCRGYDAAGRAVEVVRSIRGAPRSYYSTTYAYDIAGRLASVRYPDDYQVSYAYHAGTALLRSVVGITDFTDYAEIESYQASGQAQFIYYGNGTATTRRFDAVSGRLTSIATEDPQLAELHRRSYQYSAAGDIVGIAEVGAAGAVARSYQYDRRHRLVGETSAGAAELFQPAEISPAFDNMFPLHGPKLVAVDGNEHEIAYDANGNMVRLPDLSNPAGTRERFVTYNADNMPVRIGYAGEIGGTTAGAGSGSRSGEGSACLIGTAYAQSYVPAAVELVYDGQGRRVVKRAHGTRLTFYVGGHFEVREGVETKYIFAGSLRIARVGPSGPHFFHKDHLGSSTLVTDHASGAAVETADFLPFGMQRSHSGANIARHKYTDQEEDAETGLYNYNARLYDPVLGLFITPDSLISNPYDPQTLNRYAYARNNPLSFTDPSGHDGYGIIAGAVVGAVIGGISAGIQSNWSPKETITGALVGCVSGAVGAAVGDVTNGAISGYAGEQTFGAYLCAGMAGGSAAGATAGGLNTAIYGGSYMQNIMLGASAGAFAGAVFGSIGAYYEGAWSLERVAAQTAASAGVAQFTGGDIVQSAVIGLVTSLSAYAYYSAEKANPNPTPGDELDFKSPGKESKSNFQNAGTERGSAADPITIFSEHGWLMRFVVSRIPFVSPMATWHDNWLIRYPFLSQEAWDYCFRWAPGHVIGYGVTVAAHFAATNPSFYYYR
jgi:RHS repeat-associated protein